MRLHDTDRRQALSDKLNQINDPELTRMVQDAQLEQLRESDNLDEITTFKLVNKMCVESLPPDQFEAWENIKTHLINNRQKLSINKAALA